MSELSNQEKEIIGVIVWSSALLAFLKLTVVLCSSWPVVMSLVYLLWAVEFLGGLALFAWWLHSGREQKTNEVMYAIEKTLDSNIELTVFSESSSESIVLTPQLAGQLAQMLIDHAQ